MNLRSICILGAWLWLAVWLSPLFSQALQLRQYGTGDGLPQSEVTAIYQDRLGYLWIGTYENGLAKYDGNRMQVYSTVEGLPNLSIRALLQDRAGNMWIGTENGLACLQLGKKIVTFTTAEGLCSNRVFSLAQDSTGALWVGTSAGVCRSAGDLMKWIDPAYLGHVPDSLFVAMPTSGRPATVWAISVLSNNSVWIGTSQGLYAVISEDDKGAKEVPELRQHDVRALLALNNGVTWVGTTTGLFTVRNGTVAPFETNLGLREPDALCLAQDRESNIWIGTRNGVIKYDGRNSVIYDTRHGLPNPNVRSILCDYEGNIWMGTWGAGIAKVFGSYIETYSHRNLLPVDAVFSLFQDRDNRIWIGTNGGGLAIIESGMASVVNASRGLPHNIVRGIAEDPDGRVWVATQGGAAQFYRGAWRTFNGKSGMPSDRLTSVFCDRNRDVWFGTFGSGAILYRNGKFFNPSAQLGIPSPTVHQIHRDRKGRLWVASNGGVLMQQDNSTRVFGTNDGLPDTTIYCIFEDHAGEMWFGTRSGGAAHYREGSFEVLNTSKGLLNNVVYFIAEDAQHRLWFGTNAGVSCYDGEKFFHLRATNGLANDECNTRAVLRDRQNRMWFGTVGGASCLDASRVPVNAPPPRTVISALKVDDRVYTQLDNLRLHETSFTTLTFNVEPLSFINEDLSTCSVMLEGLSGTTWTDLGRNRSVQYTNLAPREYTFHVRSTNALGIPSQQAVRLHFTILPAYYRSPFFLLAGVVVVAAFTYGAHRLRTRQIHKHAEMLEQAVAEKTRVLQETRDFLSTVQEFLPIGLLVLDSKRFVVEANKAAEDLFGYAGAELRSRECHSLLSSPVMNRDAVWQSFQDERHGLELVALARDGRHFICLVHADCVRNGNQELQFVILTCENVEERKQLEAKLIESEKQLALVDLVAGMGDVLNNKLSGIQGYIDLLKTEMAQGHKTDPAEIIRWAQNSVQDMSKVLRQLFEFSAYLVKLSFVSADLRTELISLEERWRNKIDIILPEMPNPIPVRIIPKLRNGLDEAIQNSIEARATSVRIDVEPLQTLSRVRLILGDNGIGVPPESITKVFLPFYKTKGTEHSGLGLWKLHQVVKQCGGTVEIVAVPDGGTQLRLTLPMATQEEMSAETRKRVLVPQLV